MNVHVFSIPNNMFLCLFYLSHAAGAHPSSMHFYKLNFSYFLTSCCRSISPERDKMRKRRKRKSHSNRTCLHKGNRKKENIQDLLKKPFLDYFYLNRFPEITAQFLKTLHIKLRTFNHFDNSTIHLPNETQMLFSPVKIDFFFSPAKQNTHLSY